MDTFAATPYRPTGLATADQAMANVVQILEWCAALTADATDGHADPWPGAPRPTGTCWAWPPTC